MKLYFDKKIAINIVHNPVQYDRIKHVEIDMHFIKIKLRNGLICTSYLKTRDQQVDILTKEITSKLFYYIISKLGISKLGIRDICAST